MGGGGQLSGTEFIRKPTLDKTTRAIATIEYEHHEIHSGEMYSCFISDAALGDNGRHVISFKTPNTAKYLHLIAGIDATGESEWKIYEDVTLTDDTGTSLPVYNRRRMSGNTSGILDTSENPDLEGYATLDAVMGSGSAIGTVITHAAMGVGKKDIEGSHRGIGEWILKPNTIYAFSIVSRSADNKVHVHLIWYEHIDKGLHTAD